MAPSLKIYVSSTSEDLADYRAAVIASLRKMGMQPVCMEDYTATGTKPVDKCLADVGGCDAYVGLFAWRYGFIPPGYDKSITELEYLEAKAKGLPTRVFLLDEKAAWPAQLRDSREGVATRIEVLRDTLKRHELVGWFKPLPQALASEVQAAVHQIVHDRYLRFKVRAFLALLGLLLVFGGYAWMTSIKPDTASIQGEVLTTEREPIPGATVELDKLPGKPLRTQARGDFSFDEVPGKLGDPVTITVSAPGYITETRKALLSRPETFKLKPGSKP